MKARELMVGNYVYSLGTNEVQKTTGITEESPFIDTITFDYLSYEEIEPVPLTEEYLFKFGFTYNEKTECYHYYDFILNKSFVMQNIDIHVCLKHVHQLQNLYFALTGEELTIKKLLL